MDLGTQPFRYSQNDESDEKNRKIHDPHVVRKHNTYNFAVPAFNNGLQKTTLEMAISDLGSKFETIHNDMTGSGWAFQRADSIKIVMGRVEHKRIEKTGQDGKGTTLKDFIPYHRGWRGSAKVINFDYRNTNFRERRDACEDWDKSSPCVMYALKIHSMYHDDKLANRDAIIKNLNNQVHKHYKDETLNAILETKVAFPPNFPNRGIQLKDISTLERKNQIPIAVYYIRPPKVVDKNKKNNNKKRLPKNQKGQIPEDEEDVTITCLRAPKPSVIRQYGGIEKICYLALISPTHVVLIPDMFAFMKSVIGSRTKRVPRGRPHLDRRCTFCFGLLYDAKMLETHIYSGSCNNGSSQPPRIVMAEPGTLIRHEINGPTECPLLTVIIDTESRLLPPDDVPLEDLVFDTDVIDDSTVTFKDNVIHCHVPQSVACLFLDNNKKNIRLPPVN